MPSRRKILVIGCGYVGAGVARILKARDEAVTGWVRSEEAAVPLRAAGFEMITGDVGSPEDWAAVPKDFDAVIHCASSHRSGPEAYAKVYREGVRQIFAHLPGAKLVFTSSTSVYAQNDGSVVTETSPAEPATETGKILRETEEISLSRGGVAVRLAGIYGPGRSVLLERLRNGEAAIEGDGARWLNAVHRDDAAAALVIALENGVAGEIYNGCDNEPVTQRAFYEWLCGRLKLPLPPEIPVRVERKRGVTNKRVSNAKLRGLGWQPLYPTFREGYQALLR